MKLWRILCERARQAIAPQHALWRNLRVFAVDLTSLRVPEALWPKFGSHKTCRGDGYAQCQAAVLYDLFARIPIATRVGSADQKEQPLLKKLLGHLASGCLLIMDAGFYSIGLFASILKRGVHFLIPMHMTGKPKRVKRFSRFDGWYQIEAGKYWKGVADVPKTMIVRIITVHRDGFRPRRLVTSLLDPNMFPTGEIAALYHERWHIETFFRELKHTLEAQSWHARNAHAFYTELVFFMLLATLTRLAMADAARSSNVSPGSLSFTQCFAYFKRALELTAYLNLDEWHSIYSDLLKCLSHSTIDVRPNRSFERNRQQRRKKRRQHLLLQIPKRIMKNAA